MNCLNGYYFLNTFKKFKKNLKLKGTFETNKKNLNKHSGLYNVKLFCIFNC